VSSALRTWPALDIQRADDDDLVQAFLIDFNLCAIDQTRFFFHSIDDRDRAVAALRVHFPTLDARSIDVADDDWAARSQAALRLITVGSLTIAPPWDIPPHSGSRIPNRESRIPAVIVIQPSMGFGTGHHATTRLCLAALQQLDLAGRSVMDVGTGSGVLAIAARKLGALGVLAIDDDGDAIEAAEANVALNHETRIALEAADFRTVKIGQFDLVIANLTGALLTDSAEWLKSSAISGGRLVLSGFMDHEEHELLASFDGCVIESRLLEDEWVCLTLVLRGNN